MRHRSTIAPLLLACLTTPLLAQPAEPLSSTAHMPIREITVFKDGHAFVQHQGSMPTDPAGHVLLDSLPNPILGTFWTSSPDRNAPLLSVIAGQRKVTIDHTAISLTDLIEANPGAEIIVQEKNLNPTGPAPEPYPATILSRPTVTGEELESTSPPNTGPRLPLKGNLILLTTAAGTRAIPIERIETVTFRNNPKSKLPSEEFRNLLTLQFRWPDNKPPKTVDINMMYVQKGIRWIPNYKITLDGNGHALVQLQATLINELSDLEDVTANLVVGVPSFAYADTPDPITLQQTAVQLSQAFQQQGQISNNFSNGIMSQTAARMTERRNVAGAGGQPAGEAPADLGPELSSSDKSEDLFIYTLSHITLRKGGRMVVPVAEFTLPTRDLYTLDIPFTPPATVARTFNSDQQRQLASLAVAPKVQHQVRLTNTSKFPLTTAPALLFSGPRVLAQTTMTYTPPGSEVDLALTTAIDVSVKKSETETKRTPAAEIWNGDKVARIDLAGKITLTSYAKKPIEVKVTRHVLGKVGEAGNDGKPEMVNVLEDSSFESSQPEWYAWRSWPDWWSHFNGIGRITWTTKLEPSKPQDLTYTWSYYWR
jgi:hypothetical protein